MSTWPKRNAKSTKSVGVQREEKFVINESLYTELLATALSSCRNRDKLLVQCLRNNTANKASGPLVELSLKFYRLDLAFNITAGVVKSKKLVKARREGVLKAWTIHMDVHANMFSAASPWDDTLACRIADCLLDLSLSLNNNDDTIRILQWVAHSDVLRMSTLALDRPELAQETLIEYSLQRGVYSVVIAILRRALYAQDKLRFSTALQQLSSHIWVSKDDEKGRMPCDSENVESLIWLVTAETEAKQENLATVSSLMNQRSRVAALFVVEVLGMKGDSLLQQQMNQLVNLHRDLRDYFVKLAVQERRNMANCTSTGVRLDQKSKAMNPRVSKKKAANRSWFERNLQEKLNTSTSLSQPQTADICPESTQSQTNKVAHRTWTEPPETVHNVSSGSRRVENKNDFPPSGAASQCFISPEDKANILDRDQASQETDIVGNAVPPSASRKKKRNRKKKGRKKK